MNTLGNQPYFGMYAPRGTSTALPPSSVLSRRTLNSRNESSTPPVSYPPQSDSGKQVPYKVYESKRSLAEKELIRMRTEALRTAEKAEAEDTRKHNQFQLEEARDLWQALKEELQPDKFREFYKALQEGSLESSPSHREQVLTKAMASLGEDMKGLLLGGKEALLRFKPRGTNQSPDYIALSSRPHSPFSDAGSESTVRNLSRPHSPDSDAGSEGTARGFSRSTTPTLNAYNETADARRVIKGKFKLEED